MSEEVWPGLVLWVDSGNATLQHVELVYDCLQSRALLCLNFDCGLAALLLSQTLWQNSTRFLSRIHNLWVLLSRYFYLSNLNLLGCWNDRVLHQYTVTVLQCIGLRSTLCSLVQLYNRSLGVFYVFIMHQAALWLLFGFLVHLLRKFTYRTRIRIILVDDWAHRIY